MYCDKKEQFLIELYGKKITRRTFDEGDIISFLILIRSHLDVRYHYIHDVAHLVAHRHRKQGMATKAISGAIKNQYETESGSKYVKGYQGMKTDEWKKEWYSLGKEYGFEVTNQTIVEITLCVMSILQFTTYDDEDGHKGTIYLLQSDDGQLSACTLEDGLTQPYVTYFVLDSVEFRKLYSSRQIDDPVLVVRNDAGEAVLQNCNKERIL